MILPNNTVVVNGMLADVEQNTLSAQIANPLVTDEYHSKKTLAEIFQVNKHTFQILKYTANYWPLDSTVDITDNSKLNYRRLYMVVRSLLGFYIAYTFFGSIYVLIINGRSFTIDLVCRITAFVAALSVVPAQIFNQRRLQNIAHIQDSKVLDQNARITSYYGIFSFLTVFVGVCFTGIGSGLYANIYMFVMLTVAMYLTFTLMFLLLDLFGAQYLIDQLHLLADTKQLTMELFCTVRNDINARSHHSRLITDLIIAPCLASCGCIIFLIIFLDKQNSSVQAFMFSCGFICLFLKELLFVAIAFWYVAKVNGRADELTLKLSTEIWCPVADMNSGAVKAPDLHRLSIHASSLSQPISFTLLFKRLSWQNVAVSAAGFAVTIFISLVKLAIGL